MLHLESQVVLRTASHRKFVVSHPHWLAALQLAKELLWHPAGTWAPDGCDAEEWHGEYDEPCGQQVGHKDALYFYQALERSFYREPDDDESYYTETYPWSVFCGQGKDTLEKLITFCRETRGFEIEGWERVRVERQH